MLQGLPPGRDEGRIDSTQRSARHVHPHRGQRHAHRWKDAPPPAPAPPRRAHYGSDHRLSAQRHPWTPVAGARGVLAHPRHGGARARACRGDRRALRPCGSGRHDALADTPARAAAAGLRDPWREQTGDRSRRRDPVALGLARRDRTRRAARGTGRLKESNVNRNLAWIPLSALALAACSTQPTPSERDRKAELARAFEAYRPLGERPKLPVLNATSTAEDFARFAVLNSPRVEERFREWERSVAEITIARSPPDPSLSLELEVGRMLEALRPGFQTMIPGPGKLALAAEAQSSAAAARRHEFEQVALEAAFRAQAAWLRAGWISEVLTVRRDVVDVVREMEDLASAQFRVGNVSQQDVLRAQIERDEQSNEIASLEDSRSLVAAEIRSALGLAATDSIPPLPDNLPQTLSELPAGDLLDSALAGNHELAALREEIREAESMVALARKTSKPDFMLGLGIDFVSPLMIMPEAGVTLPIYRDKISAMVSAALASRHAADARLAGAKLDLVVRLADAHFRLRDANRRLVLVRDSLLPKAEAALASARTAYQTNKTDMTALLEAERTLLEFRIEQATMTMERETAQAEVRLVVIGSRDVSRVVGVEERSQ
ncbi:MAG: TolC family protein [Planctomycetota bacterium]|nr:MAG: TolC family protein [Planctomycetota bacterium]